MAITPEFCLSLDGKGGSKPLSWDKIPNKPVKPLWIHIDYKDEENQEWLKDMGLDDRVIENLIDEETSPRYFPRKNGILVVMRGVNIQKSADIDDMIALHIWVEEKRILTLSHRSMSAVKKIRTQLKKGKGPKTPSDIFIAISKILTEQIETAIAKIADEVDELEELVIEAESFKNKSIRENLSQLRHKIVGLRRYIVPQRDVAKVLRNVDHTVLSEENTNQLREIYLDMSKAVEDLNSARDHSTVTQEELDSRTNVNLNQTMYLMSIVIVIFTPLTFVTGLLGANIGGIPFNQDDRGFITIAVFLFIIALLQLFFLKKMRWF